MIKKILITLFLFSVFVGNINAKELGNSFDNTDPVRQEKIRAKMTDEHYKTLVETLKGHTKNGQPITEQIARQMVNDGGLIGPITKCAESIANGGTSCGDGNGDGIPVPQLNPTVTSTSEGDENADQNKNDCLYNVDATGTGADIRHALEKCVGNSSLVQVEDAFVTGGLKNVINGWIQKIAGFLALGAMFAIVFGSLRLTLSRGEEENIKKAKDIIKWGILGFVAVISAGFLIAGLVNLIYAIAP